MVTILVAVVAKPRKRRKAAGPEEPRIKKKYSSDGREIKENWQESRRVWIEDCIVKKGEFWKDEKTGKPRDLSFKDISRLYSEQISKQTGKYRADSRFGKKGKILPATTTTTTTTTIFSTRSKRGKAKADLLAKMGGANLAHANDGKKEIDTVESGTQEVYEFMSAQQFAQVAERTKLPADHKFSIKEYCDFTWRIQNPSPLDDLGDDEEEKDKPKVDKWTDTGIEAESWWGEDQEDESEVNIDEM